MIQKLVKNKTIASTKLNYIGKLVNLETFSLSKNINDESIDSHFLNFTKNINEKGF